MLRKTMVTARKNLSPSSTATLLTRMPISRIPTRAYNYGSDFDFNQAWAMNPANPASPLYYNLYSDDSSSSHSIKNEIPKKSPTNKDISDKSKKTLTKKDMSAKLKKPSPNKEMSEKLKKQPTNKNLSSDNPKKIFIERKTAYLAGAGMFAAGVTTGIIGTNLSEKSKIRMSK